MFCSNSARAQAPEIEILGAFETRYGDFGRSRSRAHNVRAAAERLFSIVIQPEQQFSFNGVIGERTEETGFLPAPVIASGRIRRDVGGGICQVASTIYAAAMYSGLRIIERHPHSRISSYIRPGLDASVNWGTKDLIIENPFHFPVMLMVLIVPGQQEMEELVIVAFSSEVQKFNIRITFTRQILSGFDVFEEVDSNLSFGERIVVESGTPKVRAVVHRTFLVSSGKEVISVEHIESIYESSNRVIHFGSQGD